MISSKERTYSRKHFLELLGVLIFSIILLDPFDLSLRFIYTGFDPEIIRSSILSLGIWAPAGMIVLEILQVLIVPIPPITMVASGFTFGSLMGSIYSLIGMSIGSITAILLSRKFGKALIARFISDEHSYKFYSLADKHGPITFTVMFLAPGFPHDLLCYIAGLTDIDIRKLATAVCLGRLPTVIALVLTGDSIADSQIVLTAIILGIFAVAGLLTVKNEKEIIRKGKQIEKHLYRRK